jgi:rhodanese-related sulfurtransferase
MNEFGTFIYHNWELFLALVVIIGLLLRATIGSGGGGRGVDPQEATRMINRDNAVVVDVREPSEVAEGRIVGSVHIPLGELENRIDELKKYSDRPIICNCRSGNRSARACSILRKNGFDNVHNLRGGIMAWQQANLPLSKK